MIYLDTSGAAKLVVAEAESEALQRWLDARPETPLVTSVVGRIELLRVVARHAPHASARAHRLLDEMFVADLTPSIVRLAERLTPPTVRTLDALHLATALDLADDLTCLVTYDTRLAEAAAAQTLSVHRPH